MSILVMSGGTKGTAQTVTWLCEAMFLPINHFEGPTEVQLNSW